MECKLVHTVDLAKHDIFIGEVIETYREDECLTNGTVDFAKVRLILFVMNDRGYWTIGNRFAQAWNIGKQYKSS